MSESKHTPGPIEVGYGRKGITGPTCPAANGATCGEQCNDEFDGSVVDSQVITVQDITAGTASFNSCVAIIPSRSGIDERDANAILFAAAYNSYDRHCKDPVQAAESDLLGECVEVLKMSQWGNAEKLSSAVCPCCDNSKNQGHASDCRLAAILGRVK